MRVAFACVLAALCLPPPPARAATPPPQAAQVAQAIADRRARVAEFEVIKAAAEELGVRVWLFGGTAAGYAHYVRWDLAREGGDERYRQSFFDYDFTNIYRSTQDADLVVDGTPEQAVELERLIKEKMGFLQGSKDHWEVRLLRQDRLTPGGQVKQALLANRDFLDQHTDSNSTGMVELTDPPAGETVVRDLRDWERAEPFFLQDVTEGRLHYYWSESHQATSRFREGHNPPLFSVIRYLVKAFQYGLTVDGEDLKQVKAIIDAFDPKRDPEGMSDWAKGWLERYGRNLIRHAVDVEYAWNTLESLGLREKLIALSDPAKEGSLGWWLSREPLRTGEVGRGEGRTARELGITTVGHETGDFLAYESMTRDVTGRPNVLVSRPDRPGESAAYGPGFYTQRGRQGARGTGLTIRFELDPRAREGTDFTVHGDYLRVLNRAALRVIPESLDLSFPDYLQLLLADGFDPSDRGVWMKLQRRLRIKPLSAADEERAVKVALDATRWYGGPFSAGQLALIAEWLSHPLADRSPRVLDRIARAVRGAIRRQAHQEELSPLLRIWFEHPLSARYPRLQADFARLAGEKIRALKVTPRLEWGTPADPARETVRGWFSLRLSTEHPELLRALIDRDDYLALEILGKRPEWVGHPELMIDLLRTVDPGTAVKVVLRKPGWERHPDLMKRVLALASWDSFARSSAASAEWDRYMDSRADGGESWYSFAASRSDAPYSATDPARDREEWAIHRGGATVREVAQLLTEPRWEGHPELVGAVLEVLPREYDQNLSLIARATRALLKAPISAGRPELVLAWLKRTDRSWDGEIGLLLAEEPWQSDPTLRASCGRRVKVKCLRASLEEESASSSERLPARIWRFLRWPSGGEECR